jgi:hypothetical protein
VGLTGLSSHPNYPAMCKRDPRIGLLMLMIAEIFSVNSSAIERVNIAGAREAALSHAVVALSGPFSTLNNQALLTENRYRVLAISFRQPYFIRGYCESALSLVYPASSAVFALGLTQTTIAAYRESNIGLAIAKALSGRLSAGLLFNYFFLNFPENGRYKGSFQVDGGITYNCSEQLIVGIHLKNIACSKVETFQYRLSFPIVIRGGASYRLTEKILLVGETIYEKCFGIGFRCGTELVFTNNFLVRGGLATNPFQHSFGFGYRLNFCDLDFAMVHHEILGYSPTISFCFIFK